jgi:serine/threonine protein kinase
VKLRCPTCGTMYEGDVKFCAKDGGRLLPIGGTPLMPTETGNSGDPGETAPRSAVDVAHVKELRHSSMAGQVLDGRYHIVKKVGEGGMSYVYLAHDVSTNERYAIKILSPGLAEDTNAMARLRREAALGIRLEHPNVCHIVRMGETEDGLVYVVMPFVEGEVLSDRNNRLGVIPISQVVTWVREIGAGLQVAHDLQIIHRDLKPENIMICTRPDGTEAAVVMDFGLAKERRSVAELEKLTATGIILGTPEFMSPEQLRGKTLDARTDVYSLALMTYEMLTGKLPFEGRTQQELMIARLRAEPIPLRERRPDLAFSEAVEKVLLRAMARDPAARPGSTVDFAHEFATAAQPLTSPPAGGGLLGKLFRR